MVRGGGGEVRRGCYVEGGGGEVRRGCYGGRGGGEMSGVVGAVVMHRVHEYSTDKHASQSRGTHDLIMNFGGGACCLLL